ncbi:helix-turn-helix domain-containing protein [Paenibacillus sp. WLX2291]|uniref:helix-turn-helix domain-containing protein n=1 Tax=Paenibacillus sp. WLX2291 TaxID=3296934 RepID=UPI00398427AF
MNDDILLSNYLANLKVEFIIANYNRCSSQWKELDYTPDYSKFYWICEGEGWLKIGRNEYYPQPRELFLLPQGIKQSYSVINEHPFQKYWCHFTAHVNGINLFKLLDIYPLCIPYQPDRLTQIFQDIITFAHSDAVYANLLVKSKLMELISYFIMNVHSDHRQLVLKNRAALDQLALVLNYIDDHIGSTITLEELAHLIYMHPNSLIRMFKQHMGMPPIQYISRKKIEKSKQLLTVTCCSISDIAQQLGFNDNFYFSKQFKKYVGLAPTDYRRYINTH